jgi:hypothetical protein
VLLSKFPNTSCESELDLDERGFITGRIEELGRVTDAPSCGFEHSSLLTLHG